MTRLLDNRADESLAELVDDLAARLHAGEPLDADDVPESLRELLPALHALVDVREPEKPETPALGKLGDFHLLREIGRGGMGVVYEAEQLSLGRRVALKVLPFAAALNPRQLQRFRAEAQAAASLHHPHIVPVYAVGCEQGVHYYAMQLIDGQTVADAIAQTRRMLGLDVATSPESTVLAAPAARPTGPGRSATTRNHGDAEYFRRVAELAAQAAEALDYAHELGIVHRDVKPANLMVDGRGQLWVTDFGLVHYAREVGLTVSGELLGTLRYMSPEQATAKRGGVDHRTDIYALGATLYELLTLEPVFAAEGRAELLQQIDRDDPTPPRRLNRAVPVELETVVLKALAKSPANRYASAREFADDLRRFLDDAPVLARRPSVAERVRRWAWRKRGCMTGIAVATVFAAVCLGASGAAVCRQRDENDRLRSQARLAVDQMYTDVAETWLARMPGLEPLQREYLQRALRFYEEFAAHDSCKACAKLEAGKAQLRVADILARLGDADKAEAAYGVALARFAALATPAARAERAVTLNHRGHLRRARGQPCEALRDYREAEAAFAALVLAAPCDAGHKEGLAGSRVNIGLARHELHDFADAEAAYRIALPSFEQLANAEGANATFRHGLAGCVNNLGLVLRDTARAEAAEEAFGKAATIWRALATQQPGVPAYRRAAATALANLGQVRAATGRLNEADVDYRAAEVLRRQLAADFPQAVPYRQELAATLHGRGLALAAAGKSADAERLLRDAFAQRQSLAAAFPGIASHQRDLAASHQAFGDVLAALGKRSAAEQAYRAALVVREKLADESPTPVHAKELTTTRDAIERVQASND